MARLRIDFQGRGEVQTFSWARLQAMGDSVQLTLCVALQLRPLRQVLVQLHIPVFIPAAVNSPVIDVVQLARLAEPLMKNGYGPYLLRVLNEPCFNPS
jgi:hypothetical protein